MSKYPSPYPWRGKEKVKLDSNAGLCDVPTPNGSSKEELKAYFFAVMNEAHPEFADVLRAEKRAEGITGDGFSYNFASFGRDGTIN